MKKYLHDPMDPAKSLKLRFRVGDLDLPERRKRYASSREDEEEIDAQMCPCGKAMESRTHMVGECEMYKEERNVLGEEKKGDAAADARDAGGGRVYPRDARRARAHPLN